MTPEQSPQTIYHHLQKIRERNDVSDVLVEITMFDDPDWPFSESILVITSASPEEVQCWFVEEIALMSVGKDGQKIRIIDGLRSLRVCIRLFVGGINSSHFFINTIKKPPNMSAAF